MLKAAKRAESLRVSMTQRGNPILEALVWTVDALDGLEHDESRMPSVPRPAELKTYRELAPDEEPSFAFWNNFITKPTEGIEPWPPAGPRPTLVRNWYSYTPRATFDDPFVDAARSLVLLDTMQ